MCATATVLEIKYLKRGEAADEPAVAARLREARAQLRGYLADEALRRQPSVRHVGLAVVFHGWEMAACEAEDGVLLNDPLEGVEE